MTAAATSATDLRDGLVLAGVHAWYDSAHILYDIELTARPGRTLALMGRNGAGKTTLLRTIARGLVRTEGSIRFAGAAFDGKRSDQVARQGVQLVPEDRRIFATMSVADNLALGAYACPKGSEPIPLNEIVELFPLLGDLMRRRGYALSGGEKQMVAVARAIVARPRLLLLDEPSEGLAPRIVEEVGEGIRRIQERFPITVLLAEQNIRFAMSLADDVCVIDNGRLQFVGTREEFDADPEIRTNYLSL